MSSESLDSYIKAARAQNLSDEEIAKRLRESGWQENDITAALSLKETPQAPVVSAAVPSTKPSFAPQAAFEASPAATIQESPLPALGSKVPSLKSTPKRNLLLYVNISIIGLLILGGSMYAYAHWIPSFSAPYSKNSALVEGLSKIKELETAEYDLSFSLRGMEREDSAVPFRYDKEKVQREIDAKRPQYERDSKRSSVIQRILQTLQLSFMERNRYPADLSQILAEPYYQNQREITDELDYTVQSDGKGYTLSIAFETADALQSVARYKDYYAEGLRIEGSTVHITEKLPYFYSNVPLVPPEPPLIKFLKNRDQVLSYLATELKIDTLISGTARFKQEEEASDPVWGRSGSLSFDAKAEFGDALYSLGFDVRVLSTAAYLKVNKFPSLPFLSSYFDVSRIKGQWIEFTKETYDEYLGSFGGYDQVSTSQIKTEEAVAAYTKMVKIIGEERLIRVTSGPKKEKVANATAYKYSFSIDGKKIGSTYRRIVNEVLSDVDQRYKEVDEQFLELVESEMFQEYFEHLEKNNAFAVWFDKEGFPVKVHFYSRIIPLEDSVRLKDRQYVLDISYTLRELNKPIVVQQPEAFLKFEDAYELLEGEPLSAARTKAKNAATKANLYNIRPMAEIFYDAEGSYGTLFTEAPCVLPGRSGTLFSDETIVSMLETAVGEDTDRETRCASNAESYAVAVELFPDSQGSSKTFFCVDSGGMSKEVFSQTAPEVIVGSAQTTYACK